MACLPIDEKTTVSDIDFFGYLFDMDQDQQQTKPRKRFVGKARKQEGAAPDSGNIEDGAVGFASMSASTVSFVLMPQLTCKVVLTLTQNRPLDPPPAEWQTRFPTKLRTILCLIR